MAKSRKRTLSVVPDCLFQLKTIVTGRNLRPVEQGKKVDTYSMLTCFSELRVAITVHKGKTILSNANGKRFKA
jgi:hypothetical protein